MACNIFINYRKEDSRWNTQALYNELLKYFEKDSIFKDFNTIGIGDDYVESINKALEQCDVLLVIIGKNWLEVKNKNGTSRINDRNDFVRMEIATALKRNIKVIPVLFDNIEMCDEQELPDDLKPLTRRQCISINDTRFDTDVQRLAEAIQKIIPPPPPPPPPPPDPDPLPLPDPPKPPKAEPDINVITAKDRWRTGAKSAIIAVLISSALLFIQATYIKVINNLDYLPFGVLELLIVACRAAIIWLIIGLICGPRKRLLQSAVGGAFLALSIWVAIFSLSGILHAITFFMPIGALLAILVAWLIQKNKAASSIKSTH